MVATLDRHWPAMMLSPIVVPVSLTVLAIFILRRLTWRKTHPSARSPPGPRPLPLIGNLHQFPRSRPYLTWTAWGKKYGPIVKVEVLSQPMLIINSQRIATELLADRGHIYSGRPYFPFAMGEVGWDRVLTLMNPGETFREARRIFHRTLEGKRVDKFRDHIESEVHKFVVQLYRRPDMFRDHIRATAGAMILLISHGYRVINHETDKDPFIALAEQLMREGSDAITPGKWLVDLVPILKHVPSWFPGAEFKRIAKAYQVTMNRFVDEPHEYAKAEMKAGTALPSCTQMLLEEFEDDDFGSAKEENLKWTTSQLFAGGSDTTVSIILTVFLAASLHPYLLKRAHEELDAVVGSSRLPTFDDRPHLPFIEAFMTECFRYGTPAANGFPHKVTEDDVYNGYFIEKGTIIFPNFSGMLFDEEVFHNPRLFDPERYLERDTEGQWKYVASKVDPLSVSFGYGRRICPGKDFALTSSWLWTAVTLHLFDITSREANLRPISEHEWEDTQITRPTDFDCVIKPRSKHAEQLLCHIEHPDVFLRI